MRRTARLLAALLLGLPGGFYESFADLPSGPPPPRVGGAPVTDFSFDPAAAPAVDRGRLTTDAPAFATAGSYRIAHLAGDVVRVGARFSFGPWVISGGALCLSVQQQSLAEVRTVPLSPAHVVVTPTSWQVDVNRELGTAVDTVASGGFDPPLTADGTTLRTLEVRLDRARGTLSVLLPDGSRHTFQDASFGLPGRFVYVEPFKVAGPPAVLMSDARVASWWADAG